MEESAGRTGKAGDRWGGSAVDPQDEFGQSALGSTADPWRNAQARYRSLPGHRGQVHGSPAKTAFANVAHLPEYAREAVGFDGLLRRADRYLSSSLCLRGVGAPEAAPPPFQRHLPPQLGMGGTTDARGAS